MKKVLFGLLALVVLYIILCFIGPSKLDVSESKSISASADKVFKKVADLKQWDSWSPWKTKDATIVSRYYNEKTTGVGAMTSWTSKKDGGGNMEITSVTENKNVTLKSHFNDFNVDNIISLDLEKESTDKTKVTWRMQGMEEYPFFSRGMMLFMSPAKAIQEDYALGLSLLNNRVQESIHVFPTNSGNYEVQLYGWKGQTIVGLRKTIERTKLKEFYNEMKAKVYPALGANKLAPVGMPYGLIYEEKGSKVDILMGFAVNRKVDKLPYMDVVSFEDGKTYTVTHHGEYSGLGKAHEAIQTHVASKGYTVSSPVMEHYVSNDFDETRQNPNLLTRVYYFKN